MNLIEPSWKQLKSLALKGRRFERAKEIQDALEGALAYWNQHRRPYHWRKVPDVLPTPPLGGDGLILIPWAA